MTEMVGGIFKEDIRYRPHLLSVVGAGTDQPFYVAMHLSKWDVFSYMHGGSHTYCRAAGSGAGQCVSSKTSPALKVLGNERARFPPKCKRRLGLQLLETLGRTFQTSKNHHNMITNRFLPHLGKNILLQLSEWMLHFRGPCSTRPGIGSYLKLDNNVVQELPKLVMYQGSIGEREQQTRDGCSGGKLRNTPHFIVCWMCNGRDSWRKSRRDVEGMTS